MSKHQRSARRKVKRSSGKSKIANPASWSPGRQPQGQRSIVASFKDADIVYITAYPFPRPKGIKENYWGIMTTDEEKARSLGKTGQSKSHPLDTLMFESPGMTWTEVVRDAENKIRKDCPWATPVILWEHAPDGEQIALNVVASPSFSPVLQLVYNFSLLHIAAQFLRDTNIPEVEQTITDPEILVEQKNVVANPSHHSSHWRSDTPLIKDLYKQYGPKVAGHWARLPLVEISDEKYQEICARHDEIIEAVPNITGLPWPEFLFDFGVVEEKHISRDLPFLSVSNFSPAYCWVHVVYGPHVNTPWTGKWDLDKDHVMIEVIHHLLDGSEKTSLPPTVNIVARLDQWWNLILHKASMEVGDSTKLVPEELDAVEKSASEQIARDVLCHLAYFRMMPEFFVEKTPVGLRPGLNNKPWARTRPSIVLIDPSTRTHRTPHESHESHKSPIGHDRRGGIAVLKHPKYYQRGEILEVGTTENPQVLDTFYETPNFISGKGSDKKVQIWTKNKSLWYKLRTKTYDFRSAWVGPTEGKERDGTIYRVLMEKSRP